MRHIFFTFLRRIFKQPSSDDLNCILKGYIEGHLEAISKKSFSLRKVEKIRILIKAALDKDNSIVSMRQILIIGLCVLKIIDPKLYAKAENNTMTLDEMENFFRFKDWNPKIGNWPRSNWTYCLADELPDDTDWSGFVLGWKVTNPNRKTIIYEFCGLVDSFKLS